MSRRLRALMLLPTLVLAAVGCSTTVDRSTRPVDGATDSSAAGPSTTARPSGELRWRSCDGGFQCATLRVPVDYSEPGGDTLELALVRKRASDPDRRIGSLLVNPGGPGASGIELAEGLPLSRDITSRFDLVGFDPRGVGRSSPIECHSHLQEMYAADPAPTTPAATDHLLDVSRAFVDECAHKYRKLLPHLGTRDVARDMDRMRAALGDDKLNYLGFSYGTSIGQVYADMFPTKVRAMVLDGVVKLGQPGLDAADGQAVAFERALDAFLRACGSDPGCPLGSDPGAVLDRVIARARQAPIPAPGADRPLGPGEVQLGVGQALYSRYLWPSLRRAVAAADRGDGSALVDLADQYMQRNRDGSYPNAFEVYFAVSCLDWNWPSDPQAVLAAGRAVAARAPRLGEGIVTDYVRCALWPTPPQPLTPPKAIGSPVILVVSTTGDPATPYQDGVDLAEMLPRGALLTHRGEGHTAYGQGDSCVDDIVDRYLVTLETETEMTCR